MSKQLQATIDAAWEKRDGISSATKGEVREAVETAIAGLDDGTFRTAEKFGDEWVVNQWLKKAVLLSFRLYDSVPMDGGASFPGLGSAPWFDKVPLKTTGWDAARFAKGRVGLPSHDLHVHSLNYPANVTDDTAMERSTPALVRHGSLFKRSALGFSFAWNDGEKLTTDKQSDLAVLERGLISHTVFDFGATAPL